MDAGTIVTIITGVLGFLGLGHVAGRARAAAEATIASVRAIAREYVAEAIEDMARELGTKLARELTPATVEGVVWRRLVERGIKRTAARELAVHELVVVAVGKLRRELNAAASKRLPAQLGGVADGATKVAHAFTASGEIPRALEGVTWERIPDEGVEK